MKLLIRRTQRSNVGFLIVFSLCVGMLFMATLRTSMANAIRVDSQRSEVLPRSEEPMTIAPVLTLTVNTLSDVADAFVGNGICDTDQSTAGDQCTLRAAIQEANAVFGDEAINFSVTGTINLTGALPDITTNISINGPGSGQLTVRRDTGGNYRIFFTNNRNVNISGLTITNGRTPDGAAGTTSGQQGGSGGGMLIAGGVVNLNDLVVTGNRTGGGGPATGGSTSFGGPGGFGGGISASGTITMTDCLVSNNATGQGGTGGYGHAGGYGGGIYLGGSATLTNVIISGNRTGDGGVGINNGYSGGNSGYGGGLYSNAAMLHMTKVNISNNVIGNTTAADNGLGGGIMIYSGQATLTNSTVSNNLTGSVSKPPGLGGSGGGIANFGTLTVTGSTINGNATGSSEPGEGTLGGGIFNGFVLTLMNSTVSGNSTGSGGNFFNRGGGGIASSTPLEITNCTISGNTAFSGLGNGVYGSDKTTVRNSLIAGNANAGNPDVTGALVSRGHNLIGKSDGTNGFTSGSNGDQVGTLVLPLDPMLGPLANNGGPTLTHALLPTSPALDAGDNCVAQPSHCGDANIPQLTTDQRSLGFNRIVDGPDADATATVDIGAYEKQAVFPNLSNASTNEDTPVIVGFDLDDTGSVTGVTATSSNTTLVPNSSANISVTSGGSTWVLTINPVANLSGTSDITVTVNRPGGSMSSTFTLTVNPVNDAPSFTKGPDQSVNENDPAQTVNNWATNISPGPADESGQTVAFQIVSNSNPGLFAVAPAINSIGTLTFTPTPGVSGSTAIVIALSDNGGTANGGSNISATQTFNINVLEGGTLQFNSFSNYFSEGIGNAVITVIRTGGSAGEARINYATTPASPLLPDYAATAGADYTPTSGTLIFPNGVTTQTFSVPIINDAFDENEEQVNLTLTNASGSGSLGFPSAVILNITDNDPRPTITINDAQVIEGDSDTSNIVFTVTLSGATALPVSTSFGTVNSSAFAPSDYQALNSAMTFNPGEATKTISIKVNGDTFNEPNEAFFVRFNSSTNADIIRSLGVGTILNDDAPRVQFNSASYSVTESGGSTAITVQRLGDASGTTTVGYASSDHSNPADFIPCTSPGAGFASSRCDFTTAVGTLRFAPGETSKTFNLLVNQDNYVEGTETLSLALSNPSAGAVLGAPSSALLSITDDLTEPATNSIDTSNEFVRSQYHDFLNREPDGPGLAFWTDNIEKCNDPLRRPSGQTFAQCIDKQRESTSVAFFSSPEFQMTGGFVYRLYKGSLTGSPNYDGGSAGRFPTSLEFMRDVSQVAEGIVVNNQISGAVVEANRNRLAAEFSQRPEFTAKYGGLNNTLYVLELFNTTGIVATTAEKQTLIDALTNGIESRATVLRKIVDGTVVISEGNVQFTTTYGQAFYNQEFRRVFVFMEYVGYLRRSPDTAGFVFWLGKLNQYNGDPFQAEMVRAFIVSPEYRSRFGQP